MMRWMAPPDGMSHSMMVRRVRTHLFAWGCSACVIQGPGATGVTMSNLFWLTDKQMERLKPFFSQSHGKPRVDDRRVLSGIIFINRNGLRWCDAPREYGPPKTLYNRWKRWGDMGSSPG
jgi:hypothetical protein